MGTEEKLDKLFHALADKTRRKLLLRLAERECRVTELAEPFNMSLAAISKHLKVLESAGLLKRTVDGRVHRCTMNGEPLEKISEVISKYKSFWEEQLSSLESYLYQAARLKNKGEKKK